VVTTAAITEPGRDFAARLVEQASGRGFALAYDLLGQRAEAEDAVHDALVRTLAKIGTLRDPAALEAWFLRIVTNTCIRILRRRRVANAFARLVGMREERSAPPGTASRDHALLLAEIDQLPAMQKAALVLRYGHDLGVGDIAQLANISPETVKTHLKRARERLRDRLGVHDER
jgi:RNA polymerase sigma-70 factor, ECF subfamily